MLNAPRKNSSGEFGQASCEENLDFAAPAFSCVSPFAMRYRTSNVLRMRVGLPAWWLSLWRRFFMAVPRTASPHLPGVEE